MLTEREGRAVLKECFTAAGIEVEEDFRFREDGVDVSLDGWDPARRVGYEFVTTEAGDRAEFTPEVVASLERRMLRGELAVLLVDEVDILEDAALKKAAEGFLGFVRAKRGARTRAVDRTG